MRILVTGGAGFIGSYLVERLLERGDEVYVVDDLSTGLLENLAAVRHHEHLHLNVDTILNWPMMHETVGHCDQVVHLAAAVGVRKIIDEPVATITTNVRGTEIVLDCCSRHSTPLFVASTSEIYGKAGEKLHEERDRVMGSTTHRRWAYACTKALDEFLALAYHKEANLPVIIFRLFNTVGPRQSGQYGMVLPRFVKWALQGEPILVYGDGEQQRCFCNVRDVVGAIHRLADSSDAIGRVFNIGSTEEISIAGLAERVRDRAGSGSEIRYISYEEAYEAGFEDFRRRVPALDKIQHTIEWSPTTSLDDTIDQMIAYQREELNNGRRK